MTVTLALGSLVIYGIVCVAGRAWLHKRRTGTTPFRSGSVNGKAAAIGFGIVLLLPSTLDLTGALPRVAGGTSTAVIGLLCTAVGVTLTLCSTLAMGESWRIGIDAHERTTLITTGTYRWVRNPIYTAMVIFAAGLAALIPNVAAIAVVAVIVIGLEFVVRRIEEPHLATMHGQQYRAWAAATGRFVPRLGTLHLR